jgi:hypothetical protein
MNNCFFSDVRMLPHIQHTANSALLITRFKLDDVIM